MSSIYRRSWWIDKDGKQCPAGTAGARKRVAKTWTIKIGGKQYPGCSDKAATQQRAARLELRQVRGEEGLLDPYEQFRATPLANHVDAWVEYLEAQGRSKGYVPQSRRRVLRLIEECGWKRYADVTAECFMRWRKSALTNASHNAIDKTTAKHEPMGARTQNHYLQVAQAFFNWGKAKKRWPANPLEDVEKVDESDDVRRGRRALSEKDLNRLFAVIDDDFLLVYEFALRTGLRRAETRALRWSDLHLEEECPFIKLRASTTKSRRADVLPIEATLAEHLRVARGDADRSRRVFRYVPTIKRHKRYLEAAGIPYVDDIGQRLDWHALRHTFGTVLANAAVPPRVAMELMRHTDLKLTMKFYTDPRQLDMAKAIAGLLPMPTVPSASKSSGVDVQEGAAPDSSPADLPESNNHKPELAEMPVANAEVASHKSLPQAEINKKRPESAALGERAGEGIRTQQ